MIVGCQVHLETHSTVRLQCFQMYESKHFQNKQNSFNCDQKYDTR